VIGPNGEVNYATDSEGEGKVGEKRKKKKKRINSRGEVEYVTDEEDG